MTTLRTLTFGCRLNAYETQAMETLARDVGLGEAVIVNTCAVTGEAVRQARQAIRKARRESPGAKIVVTGCAAQTDAEQFLAMPEVDHVIGNAEKMQGEVFRALASGGASRAHVSDIMAAAEAAHHIVSGFGGRARAYVQIQNGCDHRCTFCIIPYGRGPSRSVPVETVLAQVRTFVEAGYAEVVLTGVDITAYGLDLPGAPRLGGLVRRILADVPDLKRLRLSSIDTIEADPDLIRALAEEERLMPHLHLSLQAGDDMILKRMKRRHSRGDAIAFCEAVRAIRPDVAFGADLIAGFPTETEEMFAGSERLVDDCGLAFLHVFPFSPRPGTPAARMPQLPPAIVKERAERLRRRGGAALERHLAAHVGKTVRVLMETETAGRLDDFTEIAVAGAKGPGTIVGVAVSGATAGRLLGALAA